MEFEGVESTYQLFQEKHHKANSLEELESLRILFLGKKGLVADLMGTLRSLPKEQMPLFGDRVNKLKVEITETLKQKIDQLEQQKLQEKIDSEWTDVTLPSKKIPIGREHPVIATLNRMCDILRSMGMTQIDASEIEHDDFNFTHLNFPKNHPARDMQDTFYLNDEWLLRTHTSNFQVKAMRQYAPPLSLFSAGRVYRNEEISHRSHQQFHQLEGLYIDKEVTLQDLLAVLQQFYHRFFGKKVEVRLRKSYFPFTEPSCEVDISCFRCEGKGCPLCKETGFLEVAGAGMVHPNVLTAGGLDPEIYSGWAFGMGIDRLVLLTYKIPDIRMLWDSDLRFLSQF